MWKKISQYYSPIVDIVTFSIYVYSLIYIIYFYGQLPDQIPNHFNLAGEVTSTSGKPMLVGLFILYSSMLMTMFSLNYFLLMKPDPSREMLNYINVPFIKKDKVTDSQLPIIQAFSARLFAYMTLFLSLLFGMLITGMIQVGLGEKEGLGYSVMVVVILVVILPIVYMWFMYRALKEE
ncbi:DUF1648 domain-containing protein [Evansella sp. AB-rgal1]|uniref:DUF1648 domain-containing protein n=1 Tax=Evansella sp. AB-rgal1 TaxID=3242696 RepID=UPI00359D45F6